MDHELWRLLQERGPAEQDAYEQLVDGALTITHHPHPRTEAAVDEEVRATCARHRTGHTIGLVSISYAGLTNLASAADEIRNPDRNLPLGIRTDADRVDVEQPQLLVEDLDVGPTLVVLLTRWHAPLSQHSPHG